MSILKVPRLGHPVLRKPAAAVEPGEIEDPNFRRLIDDMIETMKEYQGVGLAAVQVHESKRLAVLEVADNPRYPEKPAVPLSILINPDIFPLTEETEEDWEGCLSIPELRGQVPRYKSIRVAALDRDGNELSFEATGFHARVVQHEVDHLRGHVFLDRMRDFSTLTYLAEYSRFWLKNER